MNQKLSDFLTQGESFLPGNHKQLKLSLIALILNRNILIEDVPGMGKTTLVKFVAKATGLDFSRIQFTSDLLPSDILGISIFQREGEKFIFRPGPIFGELILADELNRGTPKTQSALLQAMEEKQVSVDGTHHRLPERFCIFATQNPRGQFGTYPLPESQLDRFLFKISMGHLTREQEQQLLITGSRLGMIENVKPIISRDELADWQKSIHEVKASKTLVDYIADILAISRSVEDHLGMSLRAGLDLLEASKAWAWMLGRSFVLPDDVQDVFPYVAGHRMFSQLALNNNAEQSRSMELIKSVKFVRG
jgi:MoxR-like ATPase